MNNIETIAKSATSSQAVSYEPTQNAVSLFNCFALYVGILVLIACLTVCFAAAEAHAQDLASQNTAQAATTTAFGWWSLESAASAASPRFLLTTAGLPDFQAFESLKTPAALSGGTLSADPTDNYLANLTDAGSVPSWSFLSPIQTSYVQWESSLADTRTPTSVNGAIVYPLFQINYANGSLPVALYISPRN